MPILTFVYRFCLAAAILVHTVSCSHPPEKTSETPLGEKKIGVLLLNHGSRSEQWRKKLLELEQRVTEELLAIEGVHDVETAFMEHARPSIADGLRTFDSEGCSDIVVIPIFLTIGTHMFDDIPTIIGLKTNPSSIEKLKLANIERYVPNAKVHLTPPLDYSDLLKKNALRRTRALSVSPGQEGLLLVGYGSTTFDRQWTALFDKVGSSVANETGITEYATAWCGHISRYRPDSTTAAISRLLERKERAIVIPLLVSESRLFQTDIIGKGVEAIENHRKRVRYKPDAILPDSFLERWIVETVAGHAEASGGDLPKQKKPREAE